MATECTAQPAVILQKQVVLQRKREQRWRCCLLQRTLTACRSEAARHLGSMQGLTDAAGHEQLTGMPKHERELNTELSGVPDSARPQSTSVVGCRQDVRQLSNCVIWHVAVVHIVWFRSLTCGKPPETQVVLGQQQRKKKQQQQQQQQDCIV